jgi:hypothetical protein
MAEYRIYELDSAGHILSARAFTSDSNEAAVKSHRVFARDDFLAAGELCPRAPRHGLRITKE